MPALFSCISKDSALLFRDGQKVGTKIEGKIRCNVFKVTGRFCWGKKKTETDVRLMTSHNYVCMTKGRGKKLALKF